MGYRAYLLDIEGTTTPIDFVFQTLFPYARAEMASYIARHLDDPQLLNDAADLAAEHSADAPAWPEKPSPIGMTPYLLWLMDLDRKAHGLKSIQGRIWAEGYGSGRLRGEVYRDVLPAIERWKAAGAKVYIYSSGSVLAQKLLFGSLPSGDLTQVLDGYFDTEVGGKREAASYTEIARQIGLAPSEVLFLSDIEQEIHAASAAGMTAIQVVRSSDQPLASGCVATFLDV